MDGLTQTWSLPQGLPSNTGDHSGADSQAICSVIHSPPGLLVPTMSRPVQGARAAVNETDRVAFMTGAGMTVHSGGRRKHQEAGLGQGEAGHERSGCLGLDRTLCRACAAPGGMSGRPEQRPGGGNYLPGAWRGQTVKEGDGTKGPKSDLGVYSAERPRESLHGGRGEVTMSQRKRS